MSTEFNVPDATCGHCKETIETTLAGIEGVSRAELDLETKLVRIEHGPAVKSQQLVDAVSAAGYSPEV